MGRPAEVVRSRANPLVKRLRGLKERARTGGELMLLEGPKLLAEALRSGVEVVEVALAEEAETASLADELRARGVEPRVLEAELLASLSETRTSQGVLAVARRPRFDVEGLFRAEAPLVVVLAGIQDPGNLGGLLRTAEAAGAQGALLTAGCADPFAWKSLRGAMGSALRLPHVAGVGLDEAVALLRARGLRLAATVAPAVAGARAHVDADLRGPLALAFGSEGSGLPASLIAAAQLRLTVPTAGAVESLNVGVAAGVILFEAARQRRA